MSTVAYSSYIVDNLASAISPESLINSTHFRITSNNGRVAGDAEKYVVSRFADLEEYLGADIYEEMSFDDKVALLTIAGSLSFDGRINPIKLLKRIQESEAE